jgi:hypothetical protein
MRAEAKCLNALGYFFARSNVVLVLSSAILFFHLFFTNGRLVKKLISFLRVLP